MTILLYSIYTHCMQLARNTIQHTFSKTYSYYIKHNGSISSISAVCITTQTLGVSYKSNFKISRMYNFYYLVQTAHVSSFSGLYGGQGIPLHAASTWYNTAP